MSFFDWLEFIETDSLCFVKPIEKSEILSVNLFRDGFVSSFSMILLAELADKTFFIAAIMGTV